MMDRIITWKNVAYAYDVHIARLRRNMLEEPERGVYWNTELAIAIECRNEALELAEREKHEAAIW